MKDASGDQPLDGQSRWWDEGPPWIVSEIVTAGLAAVVAFVLIILVQNRYDDERQRLQDRTDDRRQATQTQLSNVAFVRQVAISGSKLKPFSGLDLRGVELATLDLSCEPGSGLVESAKRCADFRNADLRGADLRGTNLKGALLEGAQLDGAIMEYTNLEEAAVYGATFDGAYLVGVNFARASLIDSSFVGAEIVADFSGASLDGSNVSSTDLRQTTGLSVEDETGDFLGALCFDPKTKFPEGMQVNRDPEDIEQVCKRFEKADGKPLGFIRG